MVQVKVNDGLLEGEILENYLGGHYYSFKGIPYAEPPIGDLRFKAPIPKKPWIGVRRAKEHGPVCYQYDVFTRNIVEGSEDCLYLNVYTPDTKPSKSLPVMVWIHGGGFTSGSGNSSFYGPDFLLKHEIILVTINYRLEVLGFLCLDTEDIPGNAGMKDQVAALRWVKNNIDNFGGDSNNITIFGESAGAASVSYHLISPMTKGLFRRAIVQSGTSNCRWAQAFEPRERAIALARMLGKETNDNKELYEFFKNAPVEDLVKRKVPIIMTEALKSINLHFSIVDEKLFSGNERFFHGDIYEHLKNGIHEGVDVIIGYTRDEGYLTFAKSSVEDIIMSFNTYLESFVPMSLTLNGKISEQLEIGRKMKHYYYGKDKITANNLEPLVKFLSFNSFNYDIMQWAKLCVNNKKHNVYLYKFNCVSERNIMAQVLGASKDILNKPIVCHADDLMYLFNVKVSGVTTDKTSKTFEMINNTTTLWSNFAKYGNPTPDNTLGVIWTPYCKAEEIYLDIGDELKIGKSPDREELLFWESIFEQYLPNLSIKFNGK